MASCLIFTSQYHILIKICLCAGHTRGRLMCMYGKCGLIRATNDLCRRWCLTLILCGISTIHMYILNIYFLSIKRPYTFVQTYIIISCERRAWVDTKTTCVSSALWCAVITRWFSNKNKLCDIWLFYIIYTIPSCYIHFWSDAEKIT